MSYRSLTSSLPTLLQKALREPFFIPAVASVGVHVLLWFVLPILPSNSTELDEPEIRRPVSLVELTPAEQSRLPDFSTPQVTLPPLPPQSDLYSLSPLPNTFTPIPSQPPIPQYPDLSSLFNTPLPPPPPSVILPRFPRNPPLSSRPTTRIEPPPAPQSGSATPPPSSQPSSPPPNTIESPEPQAANLDTPPPLPDASASASPDGASADSPQPSAIARAIEEQQRLREQYRQLFTFNPEGTRSGLEQQQSLSWFDSELNASVDDIDDVPEVDIQAGLPREACAVRLERDPKVWFGVVVNSEGNLVAQPEKFRSSGYGFFDQKALELIAQRTFESGSGDEPDYLLNGNRVYFVTVTFNRSQNNCQPAAAPTPAPAS